MVARRRIDPQFWIETMNMNDGSVAVAEEDEELESMRDRAEKMTATMTRV